MKYKVGDKLRYDSGDWRFYGTVSAVFESSISPCYRLNVERMEKKSCKLSLTQFEFELEAYNDEVDGVNEKNRRLVQFEKEQYPNLVADKKSETIKEPTPEKKQKQKQEPEPKEIELTQIQTKEPEKGKISEAWDRSLESYRKGERNYLIHNWMFLNRKQFKAGTLSREKLEKLKQINFPFEVTRKKVVKTPKTDAPKRKRGNEWEIYFESYQKGEKSDVISSWIANNRKEFKTGKLTEAKYEKLLGINFTFDTAPMKDDGWEKHLEEWKKGERRSKPIQQWKQRSLKQYSEDKLSVDRILKLREVGILE